MILYEGIDFGEGPRWHDGRLWLSDFYNHVVLAIGLDGQAERIAEVPGQPSGLGWLPDGTLLAVSMTDERVVRIDDGVVTDHADLSGIATGHCNDMVVADNGIAYVGNFGWDLFSDWTEPVPATLALVRPDGSVEAAADDLLFPNGSVIADGGSTLLVAETFGERITAFSIDASGRLGDRRVWATLPGIFPDGTALDAAGGLWVADAIGNQFVRVVEGGDITDRISVEQPSFACALGGVDGNTLFMLTAPGATPDDCAGKGLGRVETLTVEVPAQR